MIKPSDQQPQQTGLARVTAHYSAQSVSACQALALWHLHAGVSDALLTMLLNATPSVLSKRPLGHVGCARQERAPRRHKLSDEV